MAIKTLPPKLADVTLVDVTPEAAAATRAKLAENAAWDGEHIDRRTKVDAGVAKRLLSHAAYAVSKIEDRSKVRSYAQAMGKLDGKGNVPGTVTLQFKAANLFALASKHDADDIVSDIVKAWTTRTDRQLSGKDGDLAAISKRLAEQGIGVRKTADREQMTEHQRAVAFVRSKLAPIIRVSMGETFSAGDKKHAGFNAMEYLRFMLDNPGKPVEPTLYRKVEAKSDAGRLLEELKASLPPVKPEAEAAVVGSPVEIPAEAAGA